MTTNLNIYQRLNAIRQKVAYVKRDKKVENYNAVTFDGIVAETRDWFVEMGVMILPSLMSEAMIDTGAKSSKGNPLYRYESVFNVCFMNCDDPTDSFAVKIPAHANDYGDKAPGKAITYATKAAVLKVLFLETGENDEARVTLNLAPGEEVSEEEMQKFIGDIEGAKTQEELLKVYAPAIARASKDKDAKAKLVQAKDARKLVLSAQKGGAK